METISNINNCIGVWGTKQQHPHAVHERLLTRCWKRLTPGPSVLREWHLRGSGSGEDSWVLIPWGNKTTRRDENTVVSFQLLSNRASVLHQCSFGRLRRALTDRG